jgi:predicted lipoprotein
MRDSFLELIKATKNETKANDIIYVRLPSNIIKKTIKNRHLSQQIANCQNDVSHVTISEMFHSTAFRDALDSLQGGNDAHG